MLLIGLLSRPVHLFNIFHSRLHRSLICRHDLIDNEKMGGIFDVGVSCFRGSGTFKINVVRIEILLQEKYAYYEVKYIQPHFPGKNLLV